MLIMNMISNLSKDKEVQFMSHAIQVIEDQRANSIKQLEAILIKPFESLLERIKELKEFGKKWRRLCYTYDSLADKFSQIKKNSSRLEEADQELQETRKQYLLMTLEYSVRINVLEAKRRLDILHGFTDVTFVYESGLSQAQDFMETWLERAKGLKDVIDKESLVFDTTEKELLNRIQGMVDDKLKNMNKEPVMSPSSRKDASSNTKARGYLFQKAKKNVMREWKRKYFMIKNGKLLCFKNSETEKPKESIDLLVCTVKLSVDSNRNYCFEIISPYKTFFLQADSKESLSMWMTSLQNEIASQLDQQDCLSKDTSEDKGRELKERLEHLDQFYLIDPKNKICVDCGDVEPTWISINLGIFICLECSGIHRSLGTHISKVRSFTLDNLDVDTLQLLKHLGNTFANEVFLKDLPDAIKKSLGEKLNKMSSRSEREQWIKGKYIEKLFVEKPKGDLQSDFLKQVKTGDLHAVYVSILQGANVNHKNPNDHHRSALHYAATAGNLLMIELLTQNSADVNVCDDLGNTAIHYASEKHAKCTALLCKKGAKLDIKNAMNMTPIELALNHENAHCVTILRLGQQANEDRLNNDDNTFIEALNSFAQEIEDLHEPSVKKSPRKTSGGVKPLRKDSNIFLANDSKFKKG